MKYNITEHEEEKMVRDYLFHEAGYSRRMLKVLKFGGGQIILNGKPVTVREKLSQGDELEVIFPPETRGDRFTADPLPLEIVFEDEHVLVVNKPAGIPTIPSFQYPGGTVANRVLAHYDKQQLSYTFHVVTRLDKDTSGLLLIAKHRFSHSLLSASQKKGQVKRAYQALVEGILPEKSGTITAPIARKPGSIIEREVAEDGQEAVTHFQVIKEREDFSIVDVQLETGRTHQIRVHFAYLGHPLAGDTLYGGSPELIGRQGLHSSKLSFLHPFNGEKYTFSAELPEDMKKLM